jgi:FlaA1/EpsC-like NDP-sugar epimerase
MNESRATAGVRIRRARWLPVIHYIVDVMIWAIALPLTTFSRYDFDLDPLTWSATLRSFAIAAIAQGIFGVLFGLYTRRWRYGSFDEVRALAGSVALTGVVLSIVNLAWFLEGAPRSVPLLSTAVAITGTVAARSAWRLRRQQQTRRSLDDAAPLVVIGAGDGGEQIVRALLSDANSAYVPVAFLDDDAERSRLSVAGVRVRGTIADLHEIAQRYEARDVLLAIPSADRDVVRSVDALVTEAGLRLLVLPSVHEIIDGLGVDDIRPVSEGDLLGRQPADIDGDAVASYVTGKRVLVTGAGGSIGSELCRQLMRFEPSELIFLERDESALHTVMLSIHGRALLDNPNLVLADIRDRERIFEVFEQQCPEVVFHAAALKHLPLLESAPAEGWKTNVLGTQNLLDAAESVGVERFVNVSTDKAANPTSVLGYTKRLTERLTADMAARATGTYVSVRFGNVLGSRGSVLPAFRVQAEKGGPITVTHPDITRYFMLVEEAALLTINAGAIGRDGEVLVLDMGEPIKIADVAQRFAATHTPPLDIVFTGLRPGEKLHEDLIALDETGGRPFHPLITHVTVPPIAAVELDELHGLRGDRLRISLAEFARVEPAGADLALSSTSTW